MGKDITRNVWCKYYGTCLDKAVVTGKRFDCARCEFRDDQSGKDDISDFFGCLLLIAALFFPNEYKIYLEEKRREAQTLTKQALNCDENVNV